MDTSETQESSANPTKKTSLREEIPGERRSERSRKAVDSFVVVGTVKKDDEFRVPEGPGMKLRDIPQLQETIMKCTKKNAEILAKLYQVMFGRRYSAAIFKHVKEHILDFSGFPVINDEKEREKFRDELAVKLCRGTRGFVEEIMDFLHIERSRKSFTDKNLEHTKDEMVYRIIDWLESPNADLKSTSKADKPKRKTVKTKGTKDKKKETKPVLDDRETDDEAELPMKAPPTKKRETKRKAPSKPKDDAAPKKRAKKQIAKQDEAETESDVEDFEAMARKAEEKMPPQSSPSPPSDNTLSQDLKDRVKKIMDEGDVEKLTLKSVMETLMNDLQTDITMHKRAIKDFIADIL